MFWGAARSRAEAARRLQVAVALAFAAGTLPVPADAMGLFSGGAGALAHRSEAILAGDNVSVVAKTSMQSQVLARPRNVALLNQMNDLYSQGTSQLAAAQTGAIMNSVHAVMLTDQLSVFTLSGVTYVEHEGYKVTAKGVAANTVGFDAISGGLTVGVRYDLSPFFSMQPQSFALGIIGNHTHTSIGIGADAMMEAEGIQHSGGGTDENFTGGVYSIFAPDPFYVIGFTSFSWGLPRYASAISDNSSSFDTQGTLSSLFAGSIVPIMGSVKADLRGGIIYSTNQAGTYSDSDGHVFSNSFIGENDAEISAKLFSLLTFDSEELRPFIQAGASQRLSYANKIIIDGDAYDFTDAGLQEFGRVGIDFNLSNGTQAYIAFGGAKSASSQSLSGQIGITLKPD